MFYRLRVTNERRAVLDSGPTIEGRRASEILLGSPAQSGPNFRVAATPLQPWTGHAPSGSPRRVARCDRDGPNAIDVDLLMIRRTTTPFEGVILLFFFELKCG